MKSKTMFKKFFYITLLFLFLFAAYTPARATVYLNLDAEGGTVGQTVPNPPFWQDGSGAGGDKGRYQSSGGAAQGTKYFQWQTFDLQHDAWTLADVNNGTPITNIIGETFYLAYFSRFDRINNRDIWYDGVVDQNADKAMYLWGDFTRWGIMYGQWDSHASNQDHKYSIYLIDSNGYNLNPELKITSTYLQNASGYSRYSPIQLDYERWYSFVLAVRMAADNTGYVAVYVDGVKVYELDNVQTVASTSATIDNLNMHGTIAQPSYNAPAHYRKFDAFLFTDNWQDIVDGGYLSGDGSDTQSPSVPAGLSAQAVSSSQINLSWTASTDNVGVTGYRIYRCTGSSCTPSTQIATSTTNSYQNTGLAANTTYVYRVAAYDAAGNVSSQSSSATAATQAGTDTTPPSAPTGLAVN